MSVHTCDTRTYAPVGRWETLRGTTARFTPDRNYTGKHKGSRHRTKSGMQMRPDTRTGHKRAEPSALALPHRWGPPGAHVRTPANPASHAPRFRRAATKRTPNLAAGGLESRREGAARRRPQASVSFRHRSPAVPWKLGGGASARPAVPLAPGPVAPAAVAHAPHRHQAASPEARPPRLRRPSPESDVPAPQRAQRRRRRRRRSGVRGSAAAILAPAGSDVGGAPAAPTPTRSGARGSRLLGAPTRRDPDGLCWPHCQSLVHRGTQSVTLGGKPASPLLGQADHGRVMAEGFIAPQRIYHPSHGQGCWAWWRTL